MENELKIHTMSRTRGYCFTVNNYDEEDIEKFQSLEELERPKVQYGIIGKEVGESGTPHLQGYLYFKNANDYFNKIKKWFPTAHIEVAKGSPLDNFKYCSKDDDYIEFGQRPKGTGKRSDIDVLREKIVTRKHTNIKQVYEDEDITPSLQNLKIAQTMLPYYQPKRDRSKPKTIYYLYGPTGSGKTRHAYDEIIKDNDYHIANENGKWWDGYCGQNYVLIDDWRPSFCSTTALLQLTDRYPMTREIKGSTVQFTSDIIIFTAPDNPVNMWKGHSDKDKPHQFMRRITHLIEFQSDGTYEEKTPEQIRQMLDDYDSVKLF